MTQRDHHKNGFAPGPRFEQIARAQPDALAITQGDRHWTYDDVLKASGRYAAFLSRWPRGSEIALVFGHNAEGIIAMMGAIRAGLLCLPIDPLAPPVGIDTVLSSCAAVISEADHISWCKEMAGETPVIDGVAASSEMDDKAYDAATIDIAADAPIAVYFSSGTQGVPKGTLRTQAQLERAVRRLTETHGYTASDRLALIASFAFAGSGSVFPSGLLIGATIDIIDLRNKNMSDFAHQVRDRGITVLTVTSSLLRTLTDTLRHAPQGQGWQPRAIHVSGEPLLTQDVIKIRDTLGWTSNVVHRLACSEIGVVAEWDVDLEMCDPDGIVPAGYPVHGREFTFVDDNGTELPHGHAGELLITGHTLSGGYWKRPELTQASFSDAATSDDQDLMLYRSGDLGRVNAQGLLEIIGRKSSMVKIRGYSVDKDAVEIALRQIDGVVNAVATLEPGRNGNDFLLGYIQQGRDANLKAQPLRAALRDELPEFMIPKHVVIVDDLPLTPGGKVDRHRLPEFRRSRPSGMPTVQMPQGPVETALARIWADTLEIDDIGRDDNFFDLGGDSLDALTISMLIQKKWMIEIEESDLFDQPVLALMAARLETARAAKEEVHSPSAAS